MDVQKRRKMLEIKRRREQAASSCDVINEAEFRSVESRERDELTQTSFSSHVLRKPQRRPKKFCYSNEGSKNNSFMSDDDYGKEIEIQNNSSPYRYINLSTERANDNNNDKRPRVQSMNEGLNNIVRDSSSSYRRCNSSPTVLLRPENSLFQNQICGSASMESNNDHNNQQQNCFSPNRNVESVHFSTPKEEVYGPLSPMKTCHTKEDILQVFRRLKLSHEKNIAISEGPSDGTDRTKCFLDNKPAFRVIMEREAEKRRRGRQVLRELAFDFDQSIPHSRKIKRNGNNGMIQFFSQLFRNKSDKEIDENSIQIQKYATPKKDPGRTPLKQYSSNYSNIQSSPHNQDMDMKGNHDFQRKYSSDSIEVGNSSKASRVNNTRHRRYTTDSSGSIMQAALELDPSTLQDYDSGTPILSKSESSKDLGNLQIRCTPQSTRPTLNRARTVSVPDFSCSGSVSESESSIDSFLASDSSQVSSTSFGQESIGSSLLSESMHSKYSLEHEVSKWNGSSESATQTHNSERDDCIDSPTSNDSVTSPSSPQNNGCMKFIKTACSSSSSTQKKGKANMNVEAEDIQTNIEIDREREIFSQTSYPSLDSCDQENAIEENSIIPIEQELQVPTPPPMRPPLASPATTITHNIDLSRTHHQSRPHLLSDQSSYVSSCSSESNNKSFDDEISNFTLSCDDSPNIQERRTCPEVIADGIPTHIYEPSPPSKEDPDSGRVEQALEPLFFPDDESVPKNHEVSRSSGHTRSRSAGSIPSTRQLKDQSGRVCSNSNSCSSPFNNANPLSYSISLSSPDRDSLGNTVGTLSPMLGIGHLRSFSHSSYDSCFVFLKSLNSKNSSRSGQTDETNGLQNKNLQKMHRRHHSCDFKLSRKEHLSIIPDTNKTHRRRLSDTSLLISLEKKKRHRRSLSGGLISSRLVDRKGSSNRFKSVDILFGDEFKSKRSLSDEHFDNAWKLKPKIDVAKKFNDPKLSSLDVVSSDAGENEVLQCQSSLSRHHFIVEDDSPTGSLVIKKEFHMLKSTDSQSTPSLSPRMITQTKGLSSGEDLQKRKRIINDKERFFSIEAIISSEKQRVDAVELSKRLLCIQNWNQLDQRVTFFLLGSFFSTAFLLTVLNTTYTSVGGRTVDNDMINSLKVCSVFNVTTQDGSFTLGLPTLSPSSNASHASILFAPFFIYIFTRRISWSFSYLYLNEVVSRGLNSSQYDFPAMKENAITGALGIVWAILLVHTWKIPCFETQVERKERHGWTIDKFSSSVLLYSMGCFLLANTSLTSGTSIATESTLYTVLSTFGMLGLGKINGQFNVQIQMLASLSLLFGLMTSANDSGFWLKPCGIMIIFLSIVLGHVFRKCTSLMDKIGGKEVDLNKYVLLFACLSYGFYGIWKLFQTLSQPNSAMRLVLSHKIVKSLNYLIKKVEGK